MFTIRNVADTGGGNVTVTVVDDSLALFHVTVPRRETSDVRLAEIVGHALAARYAPGRPLGV